MSDQAQAQDTLTITLDGRPVEARKGEMVIAAAERAGVYIPRFCWHPRMKPVGMCRMCLVEIKGPKGFSLQPSCYVPVADGQEVVTRSPKVKKAQDGVLEFLLINHPLDCPVCDRGGECPLQDQTFAFGPGESRFVEEKRHWAKPIPLNSLVALDRERCIQCARCTRFALEVAGDPLIDFVSRSDITEVNTFPDGSFDSYFSGNTVEICPVGALTATPYRFRARPWDVSQVESTCTMCAVGCRMAVQSSANRLIRHLGIDSDPVNHGWLCDKGKFFYEASDSDERLTEPRVRVGDQVVEMSWGDALRTVALRLQHAVETGGAGSVAVLGGARLTNEDAYAWAKLAKGVIGTDSVDCQLDDGLPAELVLGLPRATIDDACRAPAVLLVGPDIKEELPVLYLRLREAAVDGGVPLVEVTPQPTGLTRYAAASLRHRPGEAAAVVRALLEGARGEVAGVPAADLSRAGELLRSGEDDGKAPVVVLGRPSLAESADFVVQAATALVRGLPGVRFLSGLRRGNVHGALDAGLAPGMLPGRVSLEAGRGIFAGVWDTLPAARGLDARGVLVSAAGGEVRALVLLGADPLADFPDRALAQRALDSVGFTVAVDLFLTDSARTADVVLPAAGFGEKSGTTTNIEGRVTRVSQKVTPPGTARPDWMIAAELAQAMGHDLGLESVEAVLQEMTRLAPAHAGLSAAVLADPRHRDGVVLPLADNPPPDPSSEPAEEIETRAVSAQGETEPSSPEPPRPMGLADGEVHRGEPAPSQARAAPGPALPEPAGAAPPLLDRYSFRLVSRRALYDGGAMASHCRSLAPLAPGARMSVNPRDLDRMGVASGDRLRVVSPRGALVLEAVADRGLPEGTVSIPFNQPGPGAADLIDGFAPVTDVRVETVPDGAGGEPAETGGG